MSSLSNQRLFLQEKKKGNQQIQQNQTLKKRKRKE